MFTILVCGSRDYGDYDEMFEKLNSVCDRHKLWEGKYDPDGSNKANCRVISGGRTMADQWASGWAVSYSARAQVCELDAKYGISAAAMRNAAMIEERPDIVLCFGKDSNTEDIISRAYKAHIPVQTFKQKPSGPF